MAKKKWIQSAVKEMKRKGTVGSFTAAAKPGESTVAHAARVLAPGSHASTAMKRKANFAKNVAGGNTRISKTSMKGAALANDHNDNLAAKCEFANG